MKNQGSVKTLPFTISKQTKKYNYGQFQLKLSVKRFEKFR
jgi:hypothetical protein